MHGGFLYLVAVMDWFSRFVLSWELSNTIFRSGIRLSSDQTAATMEPTMRSLRAILLTALAIVPCFATAGLAEWEIKRPGGNLISHVDPFIARERHVLAKRPARSDLRRTSGLVALLSERRGRQSKEGVFHS